MYGALWRVLPGPWWVRLLILLVAAAAIVWALMFYVFPVIGLWLTPADVIIDGS